MNTISFEKFQVNEEQRSIVFSCCSDLPCIRYDEQHQVEYEQILVINEKSVNLDRLKNGAPVLFNHDTDKLLGMVEDAYIIENKVYVKVRFSANDEFADRIFKDIIAGIIKNVSIGYQIEKYEDRQENGINKRYVEYFMIYEVSVVSIPADNNVGIRKQTILHKDDIKMSKKSKKEIEKEVIAEEQEAVKEPEKEVEVEVEKETVEEPEKEVEIDKEEVKEQTDENGETETVEYDEENKIKVLEIENEELKAQIKELQAKQCTEQEEKQCTVDDTENNREEIEKIGEDFGVAKDEVERAIANKLTVREFKKQIRNNNTKIQVKENMNAKREFQEFLKARNYDKPFVLRTFTGFGGKTGEGGESLIGTDTLDLIPALRKKLGIKGFRTMNGLHYNVSIPVQTSRNTIYQTADLRTAANESNPAFTNKTLTPVKLSGNTVIGTELIVQANDDIVGFVIDSLTREISFKLEDFMLGKVIAANPTEINYASLSAIDWQDVVAFESAVAGYDLADLAFVGSPAARGALKSIPKAANYPDFLCSADNKVNGYDFNVSGCVANDNLYFGDWSKLLLGIFGEGLDVLVNPYKYSTEGMIEVTASICVDAVVTQPDAFVIGKVQDSSSSTPESSAAPASGSGD